MTDRDLDRLIDSALPAYVAEPAPGMSARVVARAARRRLGWLPMAAAVAAAALFAFAWWPRATVGVPTKLALRQVTPAPSVVSPPPVRRAVLRSVQPRAKQGESVSVTTMPVSPQELRLAQFAAQYPELAQQAFSLEPQGPVQPLNAPEPIEIQPLSNF